MRWRSCGAGSGRHEMDREERILSLAGRVKFLARRMHLKTPLHIELDDLIGAAWLGAIHAVDRWRTPSRATLATFAAKHIWGSMQDFLRSLDDASRKARQAANVEGAPPAYVNIALDSPAAGIPKDRRAPLSFRAAEAAVDVALIMARAHLKPREMEMVRRHYLGGEGLTQIGRSLGVGEARASQIRKSAIEGLRKAA